MTDKREQRKLAAILNVDVVGYSRLMGADEAGTHDRIKALRRDVIDPNITAYHGHIVNTAGDGVLVEFPSAVDAVQYALHIQRVMIQRNEGESEERRIQLRIGINVGDVIVDEEGIFGDGVNVAVRLEGLATPGGICISGTVYDQVHNKLALDFEDIGLQAVKNISERVQVYRIGMASTLSGIKLERAPLPHRRPIVALTCLVIVLAAGAAGISQFGWGFLSGLPFLGKSGPTSPPLILDKPSLAVLPFSNLSEDSSQEYFADGMSEDLITDLSRINGLFVIARNSTFVYKGKSVDIRTIGKNLGVRYVLEGSVRKVANKLRINAQLVDTQSGGHIWAQRYDGDVTDIFRLQDKISAKIVAALRVTLTANEHLRSRKAPTQYYPAYDAYLRGLAHYRKNTFAEYPKAVENLQTAIVLDPNFSLAHAALAATYLAARRNGWKTVMKVQTEEKELEDSYYNDLNLLKLARDHLAKSWDKPTPFAYRVAAEIATLDREYVKAEHDIAKAIELDPNDADNYAQRGLISILAGKKAGVADKSDQKENRYAHITAAVADIEKAKRLDPHNPAVYWAYFGIAEYARGEYAKSADYLEKSVKQNPNNELSLVHLIAAYGRLGQQGDAKRTLDRLNNLTRKQKRPEFTVKMARSRIPYKFESDTQRLLIGLHAANMRNVLMPVE